MYYYTTYTLYGSFGSDVNVILNVTVALKYKEKYYCQNLVTIAPINTYIVFGKYLCCTRYKRMNHQKYYHNVNLLSPNTIKFLGTD